MGMSIYIKFVDTDCQENLLLPKSALDLT